MYERRVVCLSVALGSPDFRVQGGGVGADYKFSEGGRFGADGTLVFLVLGWGRSVGV